MITNPYGGRTAAPQSPRKVALAQSGSEAAGNAGVPNGRINPRSGSFMPGREALINHQGDLNASSIKDLHNAMAVLQRQVQTGEITRKPMAKTQAERNIQRDRLVQAFRSPDDSGMQAIGEVMTNEIYETLGRESFARKFMALQKLNQGEIARFKVRKKDVVAYIATSSSNVVPSTVRQFYVFPPMFNFNCSILIQDQDIAQATGDLLEEKYQDGLEQMMKKEDDLWMLLARTSAIASNDLFLFNTLTPAVFSEMQIQVNHWGIPPVAALIPFSLWTAGR